MPAKLSWRSFSLLLALLFAVVVSIGTQIGPSQARLQQTPQINLAGRWKLDTGETITISQDPAGRVTARFTPPVRCLTNSTRTILFTGELKVEGSGESAVYSLESDEFFACTRTPEMVTECGVQELFKTKFKATATESLISGENLRPHYNFEMVNGRRTNCRRDPTQDGWAPFSLTREPMPPPSPPHTPGSPPTVTPTPENPGLCANVPAKTAEDVYHINRLIDKLTKGIADAEKAPKSTRTAEGQRTRAADLRRLRDFWERIRAEPCIPREVIDLLKAVLSGSKDMCGRHCETTASWVSRLYSAPQGTEASEFLRLCNLYCPY